LQLSSAPVYLAFATPLAALALRPIDVIDEPTSPFWRQGDGPAVLIFATTLNNGQTITCCDGGALVLAAFGVNVAPAWAYFFGKQIYRACSVISLARPRPFQPLTPLS